MPNLAILISKGVVIALVAAFAAWLPVMISFTQEYDSNLWPTIAWMMAPTALMGSFGVGLPVAFLTFYLAHRHLVHYPGTLAMIANCAGIMLILTSYVLLDKEGMYILGIPSYLAAITYAGLGWFWILKPMREVQQ